MNRITKFVVINIIRNRILLIYTLLLAILSWSVFGIEDSSSKGMLTLLNIILLSVPLVSIMFSTIYIYNSSQFIELLLSQPLQRWRIWFSLFSGLAISLTIGFLVGAGIPILLYTPDNLGIMMVVMGVLITVVFIAISMLTSVLTRDNAKGIGVSIIVWLFFAILFDGIILFLMFQFSDYPIEKLLVGITAFNPIDLSRVLILLQLDVSAMMGYTGAIFKEFFGTNIGLFITFLLLILWFFIPLCISLIRFNRKDM